MNKTQAFPYVAYAVDDSLSPRALSDIPQELAGVRLVGWQCGFEPLFVAVWSYLGVSIDDGDAEDIAADYLEEIGWFTGRRTDADYVL